MRGFLHVRVSRKEEWMSSRPYRERDRGWLLRHARLAVTFMAGTHQIGDIDCNSWLGIVWEQQDAEPIILQQVFGDAFYRGLLGDAFR